MTKEKPPAIEREFSIVLNARPSCSRCRFSRIIIADDEMLIAMKLGKELLCKAGSLHREISKMPYFVFW